MSEHDARVGDVVEGGTVTFLFTDLVGSTQLIDSLGDDESDPLIRSHLRRLRAVVTRHKGQVVKSLGDGLMAAFTSAANAVDAAILMQQVVAASEPEGGPRLGLRIGINSGEAVYDGIDYYGKPVWVAQRYCDAAEGGQILVSEVVRELVGTRGGHDFVDRGTVELRGLSRPAPALEVVWDEDPDIDLASIEATTGRGVRRPVALVGLTALAGAAAAVAAIVIATASDDPRDRAGRAGTVPPSERSTVVAEVQAVSVRSVERYPGDSRAGEPSIADGGKRVAFATASNLLRSDTNDAPDVYLHDGGEVVLVSASGGEPGNAGSFAPDLSADGEWVAFLSRATNLVPGVSDGLPHVYLYGVEDGSLRVVSRRVNGTLAVSGSASPSISATGEYVAFASKARNLAIAGDANGLVDVFRHVVAQGITNRVSVAAEGVEANGPSGEADISPDGLYVGFSSRASNLVEGDSRIRDVFFYSAPTHLPVKVSDAGDGPAEAASSSPSLARDARAVAFVSEASDLIEDDSNASSDVLLWTSEGLEAVSRSSEGDLGNGASFAPSISANGRYVAFLSDATNLVEGDTNGVTDAFLHDRKRDTTIRLSLTTEGEQVEARTEAVTLSDDGRSFAFVAPAAAVAPAYVQDVPVVFSGSLR